MGVFGALLPFSLTVCSVLMPARVPLLFSPLVLAPAPAFTASLPLSNPAPDTHHLTDKCLLLSARNVMLIRHTSILLKLAESGVGASHREVCERLAGEIKDTWKTAGLGSEQHQVMVEGSIIGSRVPAGSINGYG